MTQKRFFSARVVELVLLFVAQRLAVLWASGWGEYIDGRVLIRERAEGVAGRVAIGIDHLCRADCDAYASIAVSGYRHASETALFPLFPALGRLIHALTGLNVEWSLIAVANIAAFVALLVGANLVERIAGDRAARWFAALWIACPFSLVFVVGYAEAVMAAAVVVAFDGAARGRFLRAGIAIAVGATSHVLALVAVPAVVMMCLDRSRLVRVRDVLAFALPPLLLVAYVVGVHNETQIATALTGTIARYQSAPVPASQSAAVGAGGAFGVATAIPFLACAVLLWMRRGWYALAVWGSLLAVAMWSLDVSRPGSLVATCFALFLPLAVLSSRSPSFGVAAISASAVVQGLMVYLFAHDLWVL